MRIVELGDCSMVIMKDSEDPPWVSVGDYYRKAIDYQGVIMVEKIGKDYDCDLVFQSSNDYIYSGGRLILFFKDDVDNRFALHDKVDLHLLSTRRSKK